MSFKPLLFASVALLCAALTLSADPWDRKLINAYYAQWKVYSSFTVKQIDASGTARLLDILSYADAGRKHFAASCINDYIQGHFTGAFGQNPNQWESGRVVQGPPGPAVPDTPGLFDGIEIDWEYPTAADTANATALMKEFRKQLEKVQRGRYILAFDAPAGEQNFTNINLGAVSQYINYFDLMTYDYSGPWENQTGFVAPLRQTKYDPYSTLNIDYTVNAYLAAGVPGEKILLGVPFYGYGWNVIAGGPNPNGQFDPATPLPAPGAPDPVNTEGYNYIKTVVEPLAQGFRDNRTNDGNTATPWLFDGTTFWTYDDAESLYQKMGYANRKGLGGAFAWETSGDLPDGHLAKSVFAGLHHSPIF